MLYTRGRIAEGGLGDVLAHAGTIVTTVGDVGARHSHSRAVAVRNGADASPKPVIKYLVGNASPSAVCVLMVYP